MNSEAGSERNQTQNNYSLVLSKIGDDGRYQWIVYALVIMYSAFIGVILNSVSLMYLDVQFDCTSFNVSEI